MKTSLILATVALGALTITAPAIADPAKPEMREKTIIKIVKSGEATSDVSDADVNAAMEKCRAGGRKVDTSTETKGKDGKTEKTRVIICSDGQNDEARMLSALEKARESLARLESLSPETKAKALAGLDEQLNRLKSKAPTGN
jgi:CO dehydrogenase/acetyl-CoA synthase epsilon subunit